MSSAAPPRPLKRRRTDDSSDTNHHHSLHNIQQQPAQTEPAAQDATFIRDQLLRSITAALAIVGYDSVNSSALEAFRAETEEYILHFLQTVQTSMVSSRRTAPIPADFTTALSAQNLTSTSLLPHLNLALPPSISSPQIPSPAAPEPTPLDLRPMLGAALAPQQKKQNKTDPNFGYIPSHFPPLPSRHAWQSSAVFTARERDPTKMRERATEEGVLAEQALRRLTAGARKPGGGGSMSRGARGGGSKRDEERERVWRETVGEVLGDEEMDMIGGLDGSVDEERKKEIGRGAGALRVNFDRSHWRRGAGGSGGGSAGVRT